MIEDPDLAKLSISKQCTLVGIPRSTYYYKVAPETPYNLELMNFIDQLYTKDPCLGSRRITIELNLKGHKVNRKRTRRLMQKMGLEAIYPKPNLSKSSKEHLKFPYLLKNLTINRPNLVWGADITYIPTGEGFLYLFAVLDLYSRYIVSWRLSNNLESDFCLDAVKEAFSKGIPDIFNTDQGVQFTSKEFIALLQSHGVKVSMDGKGRCFDNIFVERLWRTIKYEDIYLNNYENWKKAGEGIDTYILYYNNGRVHQSLEYKTPAFMHFELKRA